MESIKKKVQIRFQTCSTPVGQVNHDFRIRKPEYLRTDMFHNKYENLYFNFNPKEIKEKMGISWNEYNILYKEKHKRNLRKGKNSDLLIGVITLSPIINEWLEKGIVKKEELDICFMESIPKIENKIEEIFKERVQLFHYVVHYDEKTPHLHFAFSNHNKKAESAFYTIKNSGRLNEFQDVVAEVFEKVNLERGDRKSRAKHMSVVKMHKEEIKSLRAEIKSLQAVKKEIKMDVEKTKTEKKNELDILDSEIREKRDIIRRLQLKEKVLKEKEIEHAKKLDEQIRLDTKRIMESKKEEVEEVVKETLEDYSNSNFIWMKENTLESLFEQNDDLSKEVTLLEERVNTRIILDEDELIAIENEAKILLEQVSSNKTKALTLSYYEDKSKKKIKSFLGKKEEFDYKYYIAQSKTRENHLLDLVQKQNRFIEIIMRVLKKISNFYRKIVNMKKEDEIVKSAQEVKKIVHKSFLDEKVFDNREYKREGHIFNRV